MINFNGQVYWTQFLITIGSRYVVFSLLAYLIFYKILKRYFLNNKIQSSLPRNIDFIRDIVFSLLSIAIFASVAYVALYVFRPYNHVVYTSFEEFDKVWFVLSVPYMLLLHDAYFYWMHRFMHLPSIFKMVHLTHHKSTNPTPFTAYAFHPLEAVLEAGIVMLIAFLVPVHKYAILIFMLIQIAYNVYGHLGYDFYSARFIKSKFGKWINTGVAHNQHHKNFKGNYGLYTLIWDRCCGTLRSDYDDGFEKLDRQKVG
ncbi:MAG: hypothetical protein RL065_1906 [Bacteroidota bacterium]|jgi:Delta7-sterol 5-desaturase